MNVKVHSNKYMTFRKNNKSHLTQWLKENRQFLTEIGVPERIVSSERLFNYVLLHGEEADTGWTAESIEAVDATKLIQLLSKLYKNETGLDLFRILRKRANIFPSEIEIANQ